MRYGMTERLGVHEAGARAALAGGAPVAFLALVEIVLGVLGLPHAEQDPNASPRPTRSPRGSGNDSPTSFQTGLSTSSTPAFRGTPLNRGCCSSAVSSGSSRRISSSSASASTMRGRCSHRTQRSSPWDDRHSRFGASCTRSVSTACCGAGSSVRPDSLPPEHRRSRAFHPPSVVSTADGVRRSWRRGRVRHGPVSHRGGGSGEHAVLPGSCASERRRPRLGGGLAPCRRRPDTRLRRGLRFGFDASRTVRRGRAGGVARARSTPRVSGGEGPGPTRWIS